MDKQIIYFSAASCGAGKTKWAVEYMGGTTGRYIYAVDRVEEFEKRLSLIKQSANEMGCMVRVRTLSSKGGNVVTRDFPLAVEKLSQEDHAVIIMTHEAMKMVDHTVVEGLGWTIIVDEDPKIWSSSSFELSASKPFWAATYNLKPFVEGYSEITVKADAPSWKALLLDELTRPIAAFHNRVKRGAAVVNLETWDQLEERQRLTYFTIWDVGELAVYDGAVILANSFDSLVTYRLIKALKPDVAFEPLKAIGRKKVWAARHLTINYVAEDHRAGSTFFKNTETGREAVTKWADWVRANAEGTEHYWAANSARGDLKLPGKQVSPKIAGSNEYRGLTQCSVLYSAKASSHENRVFAQLTGGLIDHEAVRRDREFEDLVQIVFRSSLRMPEDERSVTVTVYDREQAQFLRDYFVAAGFPFTVDLNFVDLGIVRQWSKPGPKTDSRNPPKTAAERAAAYRAKKAAEKAA
jgi:hypothetical protein